MVLFEDIEEIFQNWRNFNDYVKALVTLTTAIGTLVLFLISIKSVLSLYRGFQLYVVNQLVCGQSLYRKYGQWVVISGATDGIGLSMAKELARRGHSIIAIGRNEDKLARIKTLLEGEPNVGQVMVVKIDLSDSSLENFEKLKDQIDPDNREIGILINNAGTLPDKFRLFNHYDLDYIRSIVNLNSLSPLFLTRIMMPGMLNRRRGLILNVSATLGSIPAPYMCVYGPTKAFLNAFSNQIQIEYASHPIDIINLTTGPVHTKLLTQASTITEPGLFIPSSDDYAKSALNAIATPINTISGCPIHGLINKVLKHLNSLGLIPILSKLHMMFNIRDYSLSPVMKRKRGLNKSETAERPEHSQSAVASRDE